MITDLRFIERDGKKVLQMQKQLDSFCTSEYSYGRVNRHYDKIWQDVPTLKEDKEND